MFVVVPVCGPIQSLGRRPSLPTGRPNVVHDFLTIGTDIFSCDALYLLYFHVIKMVLK